MWPEARRRSLCPRSEELSSAAASDCLFVRLTEWPQPMAYPADTVSQFLRRQLVPRVRRARSFVQRQRLLAQVLRGGRGEGVLGGIFIKTQVPPRRAPLSLSKHLPKLCLQMPSPGDISFHVGIWGACTSSSLRGLIPANDEN